MPNQYAQYWDTFTWINKLESQRQEALILLHESQDFVKKQIVRQKEETVSRIEELGNEIEAFLRHGVDHIRDAEAHVNDIEYITSQLTEIKKRSLILSL